MSIDSVKGGGTVERTLKLFEHFKKDFDAEVKLLSTDAGVVSDVAPNNLSKDIILLRSINDRWYVPWPSISVLVKSISWADILLIHNHWTIINALVYIVNKFIHRPYVFTPAGSLEIFGRSKFIKQLYNMLIGDRIVSNASRIIAIPYAEKEYLVDRGVESSRIVVIPNGVSESDFQESDTQAFQAKHGPHGDLAGLLRIRRNLPAARLGFQRLPRAIGSNPGRPTTRPGNCAERPGTLFAKPHDRRRRYLCPIFPRVDS